MRKVLHLLPELLLAVVALYFFVRELGTFPAPWLDDSLFLILSRSVAEGYGYTLPTLGFDWPFPNIVTAGPPLVLPSALFIYLFGYSLEAARAPMVIYLIGSSFLLYLFSKKTLGLNAARWATALLVTLSAFVNTGKPTLGEVPGFFFLLLGLLMLIRERTTRTAVLAGIALGLSAVAKLTFGLLFPGIGLAWLVALLRKEKHEAWFMFIVGTVATVIFGAWLLLTSLTGSLVQDIVTQGLGSGSHFLYPLIHYWKEFLRFQFVYFDAIVFLAAVGTYAIRKKWNSTVLIFIWSFAIMNILHVLNVPYSPWYRYLLPAHLVLLPLVPPGAWTLLGKRIGTALLLFFVASQGYWQLTYQGATRGDAPYQAAVVLQRDFAEMQLIIIEPEVYAYLPRDNENWFFLSRVILRRKYNVMEYVPSDIPNYECIPALKKMSEDEQKKEEGRLIPVYERYMIVTPPAGCPETGTTLRIVL